METYIPDARSSAIFRKFVERETSESSARIAFWRSLPDLPTRAPDGHKGSFGTTLIVGGSRGMSGAVALAGITSLVCGSGLTRVVAPSAIQDVVAGYHAEYTTIGAACDESGRLSESALETILDAARSATVVAVDEVVIVERFVVRKDRLRATEMQNVGRVFPVVGRKVDAVCETFHFVFAHELIKGTFCDAALPSVFCQQHASIINAVLYGVHGITNFRAYIINEISTKVHSF